MPGWAGFNFESSVCNWAFRGCCGIKWHQGRFIGTGCCVTKSWLFQARFVPSSLPQILSFTLCPPTTGEKHHQRDANQGVAIILSSGSLYRAADKSQAFSVRPQKNSTALAFPAGISRNWPARAGRPSRGLYQAIWRLPLKENVNTDGNRFPHFQVPKHLGMLKRFNYQLHHERTCIFLAALPTVVKCHFHLAGYVHFAGLPGCGPAAITSTSTAPGAPQAPRHRTIMSILDAAPPALPIPMDRLPPAVHLVRDRRPRSFAVAGPVFRADRGQEEAKPIFCGNQPLMNFALRYGDR